ncbi:TLD domain-containing protein 2 isoform X6 [Gallus gallus]|uniref:TLD domain-containing protein 2 isoform X6 n=1 Tax=Gallus gallus TaxID=9031 RepID=UPI001AE483A8|nr:TLD domain-containing protein 2 isoform X6 [Gallus gallus]
MRGLRAHYHLLEPGAAACFCPAALLQSSGDMGCARSCGWPRLVASCSLAQARTLELQCNGGTAWQGARARHGMAACVGSGAGGSAKHPPLGFQPDQDEDLPTDCTEPDSEGQPGWEGAPVTSTAPEEPCRLVLSTPSSILQEREIEEGAEAASRAGTAREGVPSTCPTWVPAQCLHYHPPAWFPAEVDGGAHMDGP